MAPDKESRRQNFWLWLGSIIVLCIGAALNAWLAGR